MAGLVKAKKYDWKDSNLALFGSDHERRVKKAAAETEKAWSGAGAKVGVQIWRIVKFKVTHWPKDQYGEFYNGDSYIILNTYKEPGNEELKYDLHFWIGQYSTQDEYGTAAYKTVELDTLLDDKPVQHREVMSHESDLFKSYFGSVTLLEGGADTGFRHVKPVEYQPRLFHFRRDAKGIVVVKERPLSKHSLNSGDVFILDLGLTLYQWNGRTCNKDEKFKAGQYVSQIRGQRGGKPTIETFDEWEVDENHPFMSHLSSDPLEDNAEESTDDGFQPCILRVSDESGTMKTTLVSEGKLSKTFLDSKDVFIVDTGKKCFVWIGHSASADEKQNAMAYASNYLQGTNHFQVPVTCLKEFAKNAEFDAIMS
ncbi:PREDICTED: gelsolin-like protein 2 [Amphimedon queenslandica]|uniref:Gelsolin-like domain-containing protein n=1 Tax=Amphimedon queenslandica TaxID=400682 RepID=A0A1X7U6W4_AMPQE|nr:PREDICTED: gelsolin-like protein 2 [Amphimedon queenslandica]|eukprot:XP_003388924.1 PREDICTED: gelsolin-like protein 2 [Amphimedon queenslandica]